MDLEKRELLRDERSGIWRLVFDRPAGHLTVENERPTSPIVAPGAPGHDTRSLSLAQILEDGPEEIARLIEQLLETIFPAPAAKNK